MNNKRNNTFPHNFCIGQHEMIHDAYLKLMRKNSKNNFNNSVKMLQTPQGKLILRHISHSSWPGIHKIIDDLIKVTEITQNNSDADIKNLSKYLNAELKKIRSPDDLDVFVEKLMGRKDLYSSVKKIITILDDQQKCLELLSK